MVMKILTRKYIVGQDILPREKCAVGSTGGGVGGDKQKDGNGVEDKPVQVRPARLRENKQKITRR